jgi:hypothetical protein
MNTLRPSLLRSPPRPAMMPAVMGEQTEPAERTPNAPPEHLTFAEAGERLGLSPDAVRMRVRRGTLASVRVNDRPYVLWPQPAPPEQANEQRTERTPFANRSPVQGEPRLEVARLQGELSEVRARLADAQADRDRWHASATVAIERYNHDMQEMRGLLGREQVIALSATSTTREDVPVAHESGPQYGVQPTQVSGATLPAWRRWWRRITGSE